MAPSSLPLFVWRFAAGSGSMAQHSVPMIAGNGTCEAGYRYCPGRLLRCLCTRSGSSAVQQLYQPSVCLPD